MPICPNCKGEFTRRKEGNCPECKIEVILYRGHWFSKTDGNPTVKIMTTWERLMSIRLGKPFSIPEKLHRYRTELVHARNLLELADWDLALSKKAINILFNDPQFLWKTYASILQMWNDFPVALTMARAQREEEEKEIRRQEEAWAEMESMEDIF